MKKYYPGSIVEGKVVGIKPYGVFVSLEDEVMGLIHISEISDGFVTNINKMVKIGEIVKTKMLDINYEEDAKEAYEYIYPSRYKAYVDPDLYSPLLYSTWGELLKFKGIK